jgi:hypothetical protein
MQRIETQVRAKTKSTIALARPTHHFFATLAETICAFEESIVPRANC